MTYSYSMNEGLNVAYRASRDIELYLNSFPNTLRVINVENNPEYQKDDIDLIWEIKSNSDTCQIPIEIKADRYEKSGNYFFETISNESKNTPGCFMYTKAKYIFYYFINIKELHIIPVQKTRSWFLQNINTFKERKTSTPVGNSYYKTVGRLVPKKDVRRAIPEIKIEYLK